jgi:hypothetical protein
VADEDAAAAAETSWPSSCSRFSKPEICILKSGAQANELDRLPHSSLELAGRLVIRPNEGKSAAFPLISPGRLQTHANNTPAHLMDVTGWGGHRRRPPTSSELPSGRAAWIAHDSRARYKTSARADGAALVFPDCLLGQR